MNQEHDTDNTDKITCPYCGYAHEDSYEHNDSSGARIVCNSCEEEFELEVHVNVTYTTEKVEDKLVRTLRAILSGTYPHTYACAITNAVREFGIENMPPEFLKLLAARLEK